MDLKTYIQSERGKATALAEALGIQLTYLSQMSSGGRAVTPERASAIERATAGAVTRRDLRPDDWQAIWPELVGADGVPALVQEPRPVKSKGAPDLTHAKAATPPHQNFDRREGPDRRKTDRPSSRRGC